LTETRAGKYGRNLAVLICYVLDNKPRHYRKRFLSELQTYSFEPRKQGTPPGPGCVNELECLEEVDLDNPRHFARLIKEGIHLMYQKRTARKALLSLLENI